MALSGTTDYNHSPGPGQVELADSKLVDALIAGEPRRKRRNQELHRHYTSALDAHRSTQASKPLRQCTCGLCSKCLENAKWERIFQTKFADPDYYVRRPVFQGSSLGWL